MEDILNDVCALINVTTYKAIIITCYSWKKCIKIPIARICNFMSLVNIFPNNNWNWKVISRTASMNYILNNLDKPWCWRSMSENPNINLDFIINHYDKNWDWYKISCHKNIGLDIILAHPNLSWDWEAISHNPNITIKDILDNLDKNWDWHLISRHRNIGMEIINTYSYLN